MTHSPLGLFLLLLLTTHAARSTCEDEYSESLRSGANDVIVVQQKDGVTLESTPFQIQVGKFSSFLSFWQTREGKEVKIYVNDIQGPRSLFVTDSGMACFKENEESTWTSQEWSQIHLQFGRNDGYIQIPDLSIEIHFRVYVFRQEDRFIIADVDGTITESDLKGHVYSALGKSAHHQDVIPLLKSLSERGYQPIYLTARSLAQDDETRRYLFKTLKREGLPEGPLLLSPKTFGEALLDSTVGSPRRTKAQTLKTLLGLFEKGPAVVWGAFGNKEHDAGAYRDAGIQESKIYIVNPQGLVRRGDGKGIEINTSSYRHLRDQIHLLYPTYTQTQT